MAPEPTFKSSQLTYSRVRLAYLEKENNVKINLRKHNVAPENLNLYIQAFKQEQELEVWAKNVTDNSFKLIQKYAICALSGKLGPKRKMGDLQIPEGYYAIDGLNPNSNYFLSMRVNYPNASDKILGYKKALGNDIFIHGDCVTVGCLPLTDDKIKELYVYCTEAMNNGQQKIPVTIFPGRLSEQNLANLKEQYQTQPQIVNLWTDLKVGYDIFNTTHQLPTVTFLENGRHRVE